MKIQIKQSTFFANNLLKTYNEWTVHSIYRKTVNLQNGSNLIALQANHSPLSPISLITSYDEDTFAELPFVIAQKVNISNLDLSSTEFFNTQLTPSPEIICEMTPVIKKVIESSQANGFNLIFSKSPKVNDDFLLLAASKKLEEITLLLKAQKWQESSEKLTSLIGLGIGLTPSGDDFLCGFLAGMILKGKDQHPLYTLLRQSILNSLERTNPISQAFLHCACQKQFSLTTCNIKNSPSFDRLFQDIQSIGHSSGADTLCGVFLAVSVL